MKKIYKIIIFILLLIPVNSYALSSSNYGNQEFTNELTTKLNNYFNYEGIVYFADTSGVVDSTNIYFVPVKNKEDICVQTTGSYRYSLKIKNTSNTYVDFYPLSYTINNLNNYNEFVRGTANTSTNSFQLQWTRFYNTFDIPDCNYINDRTKDWLAKLTYTPPTNNECEECEECEVCTGGDRVDYTNYIIVGLILMSTFIMFYFITNTFKVRKEKNK